MKITITEEQLRILTERNLTDNSPNIGIGGTMSLIGVRTAPTEEESELEEVGIIAEKEPLTSKCPSGCYCRGGQCVKVTIRPNERPGLMSCGKKCAQPKSKTVAGCDSDDDCTGKDECCYTAQCLPCKDVPGEIQSRRSDRYKKLRENSHNHVHSDQQDLFHSDLSFLTDSEEDTCYDCEEVGIIAEKEPLTSKCPSGCYCSKGECWKVVLSQSGGRPTAVKCGKKCVSIVDGKTVGGNEDKPSIRRSDSDRLRRRPYSPKAKFRAS